MCFSRAERSTGLLGIVFATGKNGTNKQPCYGPDHDAHGGEARYVIPTPVQNKVDRADDAGVERT
jgi:hypothetical protein